MGSQVGTNEVLCRVAAILALALTMPLAAGAQGTAPAPGASAADPVPPGTIAAGTMTYDNGSYEGGQAIFQPAFL